MRISLCDFIYLYIRTHAFTQVVHYFFFTKSARLQERVAYVFVLKLKLSAFLLTCVGFNSRLCKDNIISRPLKIYCF